MEEREKKNQLGEKYVKQTTTDLCLDFILYFITQNNL